MSTFFVIIVISFIYVYIYTYIPNSFKSIYRSFHIFKAAQYELTSPIFYMEQYIPFLLLISYRSVEIRKLITIISFISSHYLHWKLPRFWLRLSIKQSSYNVLIWWFLSNMILNNILLFTLLNNNVFRSPHYSYWYNNHQLHISTLFVFHVLGTHSLHIARLGSSAIFHQEFEPQSLFGGKSVIGALHFHNPMPLEQKYIF